MSARMVVQLSTEELAALVRAEVAAALEAHAAANVANGPPSDWIDQDEAARILGVSREYVRRIPGLPMSRVGRRLRFQRSALDQWLAKRPARGA